MPSRRSHADKARYFKVRNAGASAAEAAREIGIAPKTGRAWEKNMRDSSGESYHQRQALARLKGPIPYNEMTKEARRGHDDFEFFRRAHFGRVSSPWQIDAAWKFQEALWTPQKEYINLNCPPGSGKSTLLHDIEAWLTVRNRAIRGMLGSATQRLANRYNGRLRRTFERMRPPQMDSTQVAAGRAVDPIASLVSWYGRFQPDDNELWRMEEFIVAQMGDIAIGEKEPTWQAFGLDTEYLGNRVDISVWDDVVTKRTMKTAESIENQRDSWDDQAETRIEPGGALFLVGQRLGPMDLYAYNKAKEAGALEDLEDASLDEIAEPYEINPEGSKKPRMYHSFVYPAHDEARCNGNHSVKNPRYWAPDDNEACLLDPVRLSWTELRQKQLSSMDKYRTVYQQEDVDPEDVLVPMAYIVGGEYNGEMLPGCFDKNRGYHELPKSLSFDTYSVVTVDMSPTMYWAVEWWLHDAATEYRYLMELERKKMDASQFLDYNPDAELEHRYTGVLEDLWQLSNKLGRPFRILIIERNGAQRFLMQLDYFRRWCALRGVSYFPHDTMANKSDPDFGVQILTTQYRHGRVRLPNKSQRGDMGFAMSDQLVREVTVWPNGTTNDCVMAQWFLEWWIPRFVMPSLDEMPRAHRPSWMKRAG